MYIIITLRQLKQQHQQNLSNCLEEFSPVSSTHPRTHSDGDLPSADKDRKIQKKRNDKARIKCINQL